MLTVAWETGISFPVVLFSVAGIFKTRSESSMINYCLRLTGFALNSAVDAG